MANKWGGLRKGAGRKIIDASRKSVCMRINDTEKEYLYRCLEGYRASKPQAAVVDYTTTLALLTFKGSYPFIIDVTFADNKLDLVKKVTQYDENISCYVSCSIEEDKKQHERMSVLFNNMKVWNNEKSVDAAVNAIKDYCQKKGYTVYLYTGKIILPDELQPGDNIVTADARKMEVDLVEEYKGKLLISGKDYFGKMSKIINADDTLFKIEGDA